MISWGGGAGDRFWGRGRLIQSLDRDHDEMFLFCFNLPLWDLFLHKAKPRHNENGRSIDSIYQISVMGFDSVGFHGMTDIYHLIPSNKAVSAGLQESDTRRRHSHSSYFHQLSPTFAYKRVFFALLYTLENEHG